MKNTTQSDFQKEVLNQSSTEPVIVMVHAPWCGPCRSIKPIVKRLADSLGFALVGIDGGAERELAATINVRAVPTMIAFRHGKEASRISPNTEKQICDFLQAAGIPVGK